MRRFLFTIQVSDDLGLLTRSLPIARELAARGHEVAFCNPARAPSRLIAEAGFPNLPVRHPLYLLNELSSRGELNPRGLYRAARAGRFRSDFGGFGRFLGQLLRLAPTRLPVPTTEVYSLDHFLATLGIVSARYVRAETAGLRRLMEAWAPDVVVDFWNPFACLAARSLGKPLATVIQADLHPANPGFIWWKEAPPRLPTVTPAFNRVLAEYGLAPLRRTEDLFVGDVTLVVGTPETDPLPPGTAAAHVGALLWQRENVRLPGWVDELGREKPLVWLYLGNPRYFAFTTPLDTHVLLRTCVEVLAGEEVQVVLTLGHHALPHALRPFPANVHVAPYLPGLEMAARADLLIHHGGYGSCQTGLYVGTPAVILPTYSERESNARRVAGVGAGEFLVPGMRWGWRRDVPADALRAATRRVLIDPAYRENARQAGARLRTYGGAEEAARRIAELAICGTCG